MKTADKGGVRDIIRSINAALSRPRAEAALTSVFEALWPSLEARIEDIEAPPANPPARTDRQILEELLQTVRNLNQVPAVSGLAAAVENADARARKELRLVTELRDQSDDTSIMAVEPGRLTIRTESNRAYETARSLLQLYAPDLMQVGLDAQAFSPTGAAFSIREHFAARSSARLSGRGDLGRPRAAGG